MDAQEIIETLGLEPHPEGGWYRETWVLVGCTVSPVFEFERFELAPEGWEPDIGS